MIDLTPVTEGKTSGGFGLPLPLPLAVPAPGGDAKQQPPAGAGDKNIWDEYYPLIQPPNQYHHRNDGSTSNFFFHGMYSAEVMWAYRDAVLAYLVALYSMVVLSLTGLVFCKQWGIAPYTPVVFAFRALWFVSPAIASLALRNSTWACFCDVFRLDSIFCFYCMMNCRKGAGPTPHVLEPIPTDLTAFCDVFVCL